MRLWELNQELEQLEQRIHTSLEYASGLNNEEDITNAQLEAEDLYRAWVDLADLQNEKILDTAEYIKYLDAITAARKEEAERIRLLAKESERRAERLRNYLHFVVSRSGKTKIEGDKCKISLRAKPPELIINCPAEELPEAFKRVKVEPDKQAIRKALSKQDLPFASLVDNQQTSIVIK